MKTWSIDIQGLRTWIVCLLSFQINVELWIELDVHQTGADVNMMNSNSNKLNQGDAMNTKREPNSLTQYLNTMACHTRKKLNIKYDGSSMSELFHNS